ncbi:MAG TPA: hypothetical protein VNX46_05735, partial [Candidatus Acidoferrum sp.]|nr:hypothetical protein [Candidatus Acidoferrum sp.]
GDDGNDHQQFNQRKRTVKILFLVKTNHSLIRRNPTQKGSILFLERALNCARTCAAASIASP